MSWLNTFATSKQESPEILALLQKIEQAWRNAEQLLEKSFSNALADGSAAADVAHGAAYIHGRGGVAAGARAKGDGGLGGAANHLAMLAAPLSHKRGHHGVGRNFSPDVAPDVLQRANHAAAAVRRQAHGVRDAVSGLPRLDRPLRPEARHGAPHSATGEDHRAWPSAGHADFSLAFSAADRGGHSTDAAGRKFRRFAQVVDPAALAGELAGSHGGGNHGQAPNARPPIGAPAGAAGSPAGNTAALQHEALIEIQRILARIESLLHSAGGGLFNFVGG